MKTPIQKCYTSPGSSPDHTWVKLEFLTISKSEKSRLASYPIDQALIQGTVPANVIIAAMDEEFAIGVVMHLRFVLAQHTSPHVIVVLPDLIPTESLTLLKGFGADIVRSPIDSVAQFAARLGEHTPNAFTISEFQDVHVDTFKSLFEEIREQGLQSNTRWKNVVSFAHSPSQFDAFVKAARAFVPNMTVVGVSFSKKLVEDLCAKYSDTGIHLVLITERDAYAAAKKAMVTNGLACGVRSGACLSVLQSNKSLGLSETLFILGDDAQKYASTLLNEEWLIEHELFDFSNLEKKYRGASVEDLQLPEAVCVYEADPVGNALNLMLSRDFSQLPVVNAKRKIVGFLTLSQLQDIGANSQWKPTDPVKQWMHAFTKSKPYKLITPATALTELETFFDRHSAAVVTDASGKFVLGLVTKIDLLKFLIKRS